MKPLAYSYVRFSSALQEKGKSFERQFKNSQKFCEEQGLELVENYSDLGVSAFRGKNKVSALGKFLENVRSGVIPSNAWLIVENLDRISRESPRKAFNDFSQMLEYGLTIVTLQDRAIYTKDNIDNDFTSLLGSVMLMYKAYRESKDKSDRILDAKQRIRKEAKEGKRIITKVAPKWLKAKDDYKGFEIIEERAKSVRLVFNLVLQGYGVLSLTKYLNDKKIPTISGADAWKAVYIKKLLKNKSVYGLYTFPKTGEVIENYFPVVVEKEVFEQVQAVMSGRNRQGGRKGEVFRNIFHHMLFCEDCKAPLHYKNHGNQYKDYVICSNSSQGISCNCSSFKYEALEIYVLMMLEQIDLQDFLSSDNDHINTVKERIKSFENENYSYEMKIKGFENQLLSNDFEFETLGMINKAVKELKQKISDNNNHINQLRLEIKDVDNTSESIFLISDVVLKLKKKLAELTGDSDKFEIRSELNRTLRSLISSISIKTYDKDNLKPFIPPHIESQTNEAKRFKAANTERYRKEFAKKESQNVINIHFKSGKVLKIYIYKEYFKGSYFEIGAAKDSKVIKSVFKNAFNYLLEAPDKSYQEFLAKRFDSFIVMGDKHFKRLQRASKA